MKRFIVYFLVACSVYSCHSQSNSDCESNAQTSPFVLKADSFEQLLNNNLQAVLLDVRTPDEFADGYIRDAVNMDYYDDFKNKINTLDKNTTYFVYCKAGSRSASAADIMRKAGFKEVYELKGGILGWENSGRKLTNEKTPVNPGLTIEAYQQLLQSAPLVLIDFNAKWCEPCQKMSPYLDELAAAYKGKAIIRKIDIDQNKALTKALRLEAIPLLILYKNGKEVWRNNSYTEKAEVQKQLNTNL